MQRGTRALTGVGLVVGGALVGMLSLTVLPWYRSSFGGILGNGTTVSDIRSSIGLYQKAPDFIPGAFDLGVSPVYFGGLAFGLLIVGALAAFAGAGLDGRTARIAAWASAVMAVAGLVLTFLAIRYVAIDPIETVEQDGTKRFTTPPTYGDFVTRSNVGAWAIVLAFVLIGVGALLAAGSREELRELLRDDYDDEADEATTDDATATDNAADDGAAAPDVATAEPPSAPPVLTKRTDDVW